MKPDIQIKYNNNRPIQSISHWLNGQLHREDGPAVTWYCENGSIVYESYLQNYQYHREDGPSRIWYEEVE